MSDLSLGHLGVAAVAVATLAAADAVPRPGSAGCDTDSPRAATFLAIANATFPRLDSVRIARLGWRKPPKAVTLVKQRAKCDSIVAAHNAFVEAKHAAYRLSDAVIAQAGSSYLVEVPPGNGIAERMIFVYDSTLKFTVVY